MGKEVWKDIDGFLGYQVSDLGHVRSSRDFHGNITENYRILKPCVNKDGYYELTLYINNGKRATKRVHKLVAEAFLGDPSGLVVNHINGKKLDNRAKNLEYVSASRNSTLASEMGLYKTKPIKIIETGEIFNSVKDCAETLGAHPSDISHVLSKAKESYKNLHFEYVDDKEQKVKGKPFLYDYQLEAVNEMRNGCILCGSVGSGKSRTGLFYYFKENGGWIDENGYVPMKSPQDLIIITTAKKRDSLEWAGELVNFLMYPDSEFSMYHNKIVIDSWNNIGKYQDIENSFFLLDEQRLVGSGAWVKAFLKIAKHNKWILLSATPGDTYSDYLPVFLANGFFKNKTEFNREHVIFSRYTKYPKIDRYIDTQRLDRLRRRVLVQMNYKHQIITNHEDIYCGYDITLYKNTMRNRWDPYNESPITNASGLCYTLRRIVNSDESRQKKLLELLEDIPRAIIFYSFDYERDILLSLGYIEGTEVAEWNGHAHQPVPDGDRWIYLCQYTSACEGWECIRTNTVIFYSPNYSYKVMTQAAGRVDRLTTPYDNLQYYYLKSRSGIDLAISKALREKRKFNETRWVKW